MGKRKKHDEPVSLPNANLSGREYTEDRPHELQGLFLLEKAQEPAAPVMSVSFFARSVKEFEERFDENGKLILDCRICPYNRVSPCIGYCIAALRREVSAAYGDRHGSEYTRQQGQESGNCKLVFPFHYGSESESYAFYRVPKARCLNLKSSGLFPRMRNFSTDC